MKTAIICLVVAACGKDDGSTSEAKPAEPATKQDEPKKAELSAARTAVVDAWKKAGLSATLTSSAGFGKACSAGTIDKLDVVICEYGSADEAKQAEQPGLAWVGSTTGAAWAEGKLVIAVADRKKSDPHGKTINQLMKSTPK